MNIPTHALLPVILVHVCVRRRDLVRPWSLAAIGLAGALPDLLCPHMYLESRMTSWSHGLPFWSAFSVLLVLVSLLSKRRLSLAMAACLSASYLLHLVCDAISGGINWMYPCKDLVWGGYWVDLVWWIPLDAICVLAVYYCFRLKPLLEKRRRMD